MRDDFKYRPHQVSFKIIGITDLLFLIPSFRPTSDAGVFGFGILQPQGGSGHIVIPPSLQLSCSCVRPILITSLMPLGHMPCALSRTVPPAPWQIKVGLLFSSKG